MTIKVPDSCFIADDAVIIGKVILGEGCSVWYKSVIRGDQNVIEIGEGSNIQDNVVIHVDGENSTHIGEDVSVGHSAVIHGCTIGDNTIIGMNASILNGAVIGKGCIIAANAVVTSGTTIPDNSLAMGIPAKVKKQDKALLEVTKANAEHYHKLRDEHKEGKYERYGTQ
ncbi:MAG: gamma carbonic anhydrase family protein [Thermoplasmata archaeon]